MGRGRDLLWEPEIGEAALNTGLQACLPPQSGSAGRADPEPQTIAFSTHSFTRQGPRDPKAFPQVPRETEWAFIYSGIIY